MKNKYLIGYDIQNDKKRRSVTKILENYGVRWQFSVFFCNFTIAERKKIEEKLNAIIDVKSDSVFIIQVSQQLLDHSLFLGHLKDRINLPAEPSFF